MSQISMAVYCEKILKQPEEMFSWYKKAAEQGNDMAQLFLGKCYLDGNGVEKDTKNAFLWFSKAANQENAKAMFYLSSVCYGRGIGVERDLKKSAEYLGKAIVYGDDDAQLELGALQEDENNPVEAFKYYKLSAEQNNPYAQFNLGRLYLIGKGVKINNEEAFNWFKKSAENGNAEAQLMLGKCYDQGTGIKKDAALAKEWYIKAAKQGLPLAIDMCKAKKIQY